MELNRYSMFLSLVLVAILSQEMVLSEPLPGHGQQNTVPYYKKQGIEKFIDDDERLRRHCKSLIESGVELENLEDDCKKIYYKEEYEDDDNGSSTISSSIGALVFAAISIFASIL